MILADKIIMLRKKNGWSQEELAEKMKVSRQSVSKWEGAQAVPDLEKILRLSGLFGVSTDYLLKEEMGEEEYSDYGEAADVDADEKPLRRVSMEEANEFLRVKEKTAGKIALATFLCILSPIALFILPIFSEMGILALSENVAGGMGLIILFLVVTIAVAIYISCGAKTEPFAYLEKEVFETEYGVSGMVKERKKAFSDTYTRSNIIGTCLCILSVIPLLTSVFVAEENEALLAIMVALLLVLVGVGVLFFISAGIRQESMQKLLQEGDYTVEKKKHSPIIGAVTTVYWLVVVAGFLVFGLYTEEWKASGIIWPVAGIIYAALVVILNAVCNKKK